MPFTVSHIVAAVPLDKGLGKYTALSPLIIGSMTPDIAYITPFLVHQRMDSHSLIGIYLFCIPMGLSIYFLYHWLIAPVVVSILPRNIQRHLHPDLFIGKLPSIPSHVLIISIVLGSITHVIWDFFTHQTGIPQHIAWMNTPLANIDGYNILPYRLLQHVSSILGLALLIFWLNLWYQRVKNKKTAENHWKAPHKLKTFAATFMLFTIALGALFNGYRHIPDSDVFYGMYSAQVFVKFAIVGGAAAFLVSCIVLGGLYQLQIRRDLQS